MSRTTRGAMAKLLELMPNAKLVASIAGANYPAQHHQPLRPGCPQGQGRRGDRPGRQDPDLYLRAKPALAGFDVHLRQGGQRPVHLRLFGLPLLRAIHLRLQRRLFQRRTMRRSNSTTAPSLALLLPLSARVWRRSRLCRSSRTLSAPATAGAHQKRPDGFGPSSGMRSGPHRWRTRFR